MSFCEDKKEVIKVEPDVFFELCEKQEPDLADNASTPTCGLMANNGPQTSLVLQPKLKIEPELPSSNSDVISCLDFEPKADFKVKLEVDECTSFNSYELSFVSENPYDNVQRLNVVVDEPVFDLEELLSLSVHRSNLDKNLFYCHHCAFSSKFRGNLLRHIKYQHLPAKFFFCNICRLKFRFKCELTKHFTFYHEEERKIPWKYCNFCHYKVDKKDRVFRHMLKHHVFQLQHGSFDQVKKCNFCSYSSESKSDLLNHFINKHEFEYSHPKRRFYHCGLCPYIADSNSTLIAHIDGFHKKIRPYACHLCEYAASRPTDLRIHISAKHNKITPYKCDTCGYASAYKKHLTRHVYTQHVNKKKRKKYGKRCKIEPVVTQELSTC